MKIRLKKPELKKPVKLPPRLVALASAGSQTKAILTMYAISAALVVSMLPALSDMHMWPDFAKLEMVGAAALTTLVLGLATDFVLHLRRKR
ncbi:hypothetical protein V8J36_18440 [Frigidibacter sp. MR17.14]|uniref:hypothetical protein n=1 Tax=Frigidibacter sp. MR17.14 TaxID=3126509 RepID=UPI003012F3B8